MQQEQNLLGTIALVAGATRGAGRAIARELGRAGAVVYCTGRSTSTQPSDYGRPETIEQTAQFIQDDGGTAHPVVVDHRDITQVRRLINRIKDDYGQLDILVNGIGGEAYVDFDIPLWEYDWERGKRLLEAGFITHLLTSHCALGLLHQRPGGLVIEVTDGTRAYNATHFRGSVFLDVTKTAVDRLAYAEGHELAAHGGTAVSVTPGWLRSEIMLDAFGVTEDNWRAKAEANRGMTDALPPYEFSISETPSMLARGLAAMAADPQRHRWNSLSVSSFQLAEHYDITDLDGSRPDSWSFIEALETTNVTDLNLDEYR